MRAAVQAGLPTDLDASLEAYIEDANIGKVLNAYFLRRLDMKQANTY